MSDSIHGLVNHLYSTGWSGRQAGVRALDRKGSVAVTERAGSITQFIYTGAEIVPTWTSN